MEQVEKDILNRIKYQMKQKGMTQIDLATLLGLEQYQISRYLSGHPYPSVPLLMKIADALHISMEYLLGYKGLSYEELSSDQMGILKAYEKAKPDIKSIVKTILKINC